MLQFINITVFIFNSCTCHSYSVFVAPWPFGPTGPSLWQINEGVKALQCFPWYLLCFTRWIFTNFKPSMHQYLPHASIRPRPPPSMAWALLIPGRFLNNILLYMVRILIYYGFHKGGWAAKWKLSCMSIQTHKWCHCAFRAPDRCSNLQCTKLLC